MPTPHCSAAPRRAFSLIELLVTIAVVGVLASLTITFIGSSRQSAQQAKNVSTIRSLLMASLMYANDNGGSMPIFGYSADGSRPLNTTRANISLAAGPQLLLSTNWHAGRGINDYLPSPSSFYGPFTPGFDAMRTPDRFAEVNGLPTMGYVHYSLPSGADANGTAPITGLANDRIGSETGANTPVYSDLVSDIYGTQFTGPKFTVAYLDGSVRTFELSTINPLGVTLRIRTIAGMVR